MTQDIWDISPKKKSLILPQKTVVQAHVEETPLPIEPMEGYFKEEVQVQEIEIPVMTDRMNEGNMLALTETINEKEMIINSSEILKPKPHVPDFRNDKLIISYSTPISKMFYKNNEIEHCPAFIKAIMSGYDMPSNETMDGGNLFETLVLGGGRDWKQTLQLTRKKVSQTQKNLALKKGLPEPQPEMRLDEIRIRMQADVTKINFFKRKIQIFPGLNTQVQVFKRFSDNVIVTGHLDLVTPIIWEDKLWQSVIDVKATQNFTTFGHYAWDDIEQMDVTQAILYWWLCQDIDYSINPMLKALKDAGMWFDENLRFFYYVVNYKCSVEKLRSEFIPLNLTPGKIRDLKELIRKCAAAIEHYEATEYLANPKYDRCLVCPLRNDCKFCIKYQTA
jgi:hypothetical protein